MDEITALQLALTVVLLGVLAPFVGFSIWRPYRALSKADSSGRARRDARENHSGDRPR
jgi:hypothetical protein